MSDTAYKESSPEEQVHFMCCRGCGEQIDCRNLDEVFEHEISHEAQPDIQYLGSGMVKPKQSLDE